MKRRREGKRHKPSPSQTRLCHGGDIDIPLDLTVEILKKLPTKSLLRFQCVSKIWSSVISSRRDFIDSIIARSLTQRPCDVHLLFYYPRDYPMECFLALSSSTCPRNTYKIPVHADLCQYVRGLIFSWSDNTKQAAIYNPTTRQSFYLPEVKTSVLGTYFFGYDPLKNQYKVLFVPLYSKEQACQVFTLGDSTEKPWKHIQGIESHFPFFEGSVCINGLIYYLIKVTEGDDNKYKLMSFDVKSEEFNQIEAPNTLMNQFSTLINYQGKLGFVYLKHGVGIWIREDVVDLETQWSNVFFYEMDDYETLGIFGVTRGGEIVFHHRMYDGSDKFRVIYCDPKQNSERYVVVDESNSWKSKHEISVFIRTFPDHVENTMRLY